MFLVPLTTSVALRLHRRNHRHCLLRLQVRWILVQALQPRVDQGEDLHPAQETSQWHLMIPGETTPPILRRPDHLMILYCPYWNLTHYSLKI